MYLHTPYLGGRTPMGVDCSGFTQMVYKWKHIPRDASQQVDLGVALSFIEEAESGDLAFFDDAEGISFMSESFWRIIILFMLLVRLLLIVLINREYLIKI